MLLNIYLEELNKVLANSSLKEEVIEQIKAQIAKLETEGLSEEDIIKELPDLDNFNLESANNTKYVEEAGTINLNLISFSDLRVIKGNKPGIKYYYDDEARDILEISQDGQDLFIREKAVNDVVDNNDYTLTIEIGTNNYILKIQSDSTDVEIKDIVIANLNIELISGDLDIKNSVIDILKAKLISGDMEIKNTKITTDSKIDMVSGDVLLDDVILDSELKIKSVSGDLEVSGKYDKSKIKFSSISGDEEWE